MLCIYMLRSLVLSAFHKFPAQHAPKFSHELSKPRRNFTSRSEKPKKRKSRGKKKEQLYRRKTRNREASIPMPAYNPLYEDEAIKARACHKCVILEALENSLSLSISLSHSLFLFAALSIVRVLRSLLSLVCYQFLAL